MVGWEAHAPSRAAFGVLAECTFWLPQKRFATGAPQTTREARVLPKPDIARRFSYSSLVHIGNRYGNHFISRGQTGKDLAHTIFTQSAHAQFTRALPQQKHGGALADHVPDFVVDHEDLEYSHSAPVAGMPAIFAAVCLHDLCIADLRWLDPERAHFGFTQLGRIFAMG